MITAPNPSPATLGGTNTYLIDAAGRAVVVDPGPDDPAHLARVIDRATHAGGRVALILVTHGHSDHAGGAARLARETGAPVRGWRNDGRPLRDGESFPLGGGACQVIFTPGHAPDHVAFYCARPRVLFSGDLILGHGTVQVTPPGGSMIDYLNSLERIARLDLTVIAPGHGPLVCDPKVRIAEYLAHRRMRERQVLDALAEIPRSAADLARALYPDLDPRLRGAAEGTVLAHLEKLVVDGRARRVGVGFTRSSRKGERRWRCR
ncbi:MAG TPA: MBL fold metallo-hydrolase [bacterium]|nr:MBL fold metallo-hydrolase [bacterium]